MSATTIESKKSKLIPPPFLFQFSAGAIAGIVEILCMYPLDLVKTRFQLQVKSNKPLATTTTYVRPYTSILDCLHRSIKERGLLSLYRGSLPPIVSEAPRRALKFGANEQWGFALKKLLSLDQFTAFQAGFVGSMAGATEAFLVTPFDLVKVRLQDRNSLEIYRGTIDCTRKIIAQEGIFAFYHGFESTVWRHATWSGAYFMTIHVFRTAFPERSRTSKYESMTRNFAAGTIGGLAGVLLSSPFDVVKSRVQNQRGVNNKYRFTFPSIARIYREEGFRALYKGLTPKMLRLGPGGGILLVVFDHVSELLLKIT